MAEVMYDDSEIENAFMDRASRLERPVPGQSLTNDPENPAPYEKPPQYTKLSDALDYYFATFTEEGTYEKLLSTIEGGMPIMELVQIFLYQGFEDGLFNPDLMMLLAEPLAYMLAALCEREDIDFVITSDVDEEEAEPTGMMQQAMSQIKDVGTEEVLPEPIQEKMSLLAPRGEQ